jgi:hypothetical protein
MVGHGVVHACLRDERVRQVTAISRGPLDVTHPKLRVRQHEDFRDLSPVADRLGQVDACYFCIGTPSAGRTEQEYRTVTYDYALAAAEALLPLNPDLTFVYVSGASADSTEQGPVMWKRVKGSAEKALLDFPFRTHVFRPGYIRPMYGARPSTRANRVVYGATSWLYPVLNRVFPDGTTTTDAIGRAMLAVTTTPGAPRILTSADINRFAAEPASRR